MNVDDAANMVGYYQYAFGSVEGEKVLQDIGIRSGSLAGHSPDASYFAGPHMTAEQRAYRDGQQDMFKSIESLLQK
jgi:hypothetical protein